MRAVVDTNVLIAALLWRGTAHRLLEQAHTGDLTLFTSPALLTELADVLARAKFSATLLRSGTTPERLLVDCRRLAKVIDPPALAQPVCRDPDDDHVLALALAARADLIVSGDADLLSLVSFQGIPIIAPGEAVRLAARQAGA